MKKGIILLSVVFLTISCTNTSSSTDVFVKNSEELLYALEHAQPGHEIVMANGNWKDIALNFYGEGTEDQPIVLRAETAGKVILGGASYIKLGGSFLEVRDLYFKNGYTPSNAIIEFRISKDQIANNCRVTNCVIDRFTQKDRFRPDHWIEFWGRNNQLDHCYIAGKSNQGPTIRVQLKGNESIYTYHKINDNHFGPRPRKGGPKAETMQIGDSETSMTPGHVQVFNNFFERCNGEVEIISSKANFNEFRNNVFFECEGSLVMRHGNYAQIDGNVFIGNDNSPFIGGIRVINTGHWITNNYFYKLKANSFRAPLAVMNGIPKSPLNRYNQVTDVVVAYNSWIDCLSPWHFSVGANLNQAEVLPPSEIRSARPIRTILANNLIYNSNIQNNPIINYDKVDGVLFKDNVVNFENKSEIQPEGLKHQKFEHNKLTDWLYAPSESIDKTYDGFGFDAIETDVFGTSRNTENGVGAIVLPAMNFESLLDYENYGTSWYKPNSDPKEIVNHEVGTTDELMSAIKNANTGDIIQLLKGAYKLNRSIAINKNLTIRTESDTEAHLIFDSKGGPAFSMEPEGTIKLENLFLSGNGKQALFATLEENMSSAFNINIENSKIENFGSLVKAFKGSFADTVRISKSRIANCINGIELAEEIDDKGDYNAEFVLIENSEFIGVKKNVINYYRGGYDESTIGGNLNVVNSAFVNCAEMEESGILLKTRGIINVNLQNNRFENNPVQRIAVLWGEKGQRPGENSIKNSGKIEVVQNLKLKLMY